MHICSVQFFLISVSCQLSTDQWCSIQLLCNLCPAQRLSRWKMNMEYNTPTLSTTRHMSMWDHWFWAVQAFSGGRWVPLLHLLHCRPSVPIHLWVVCHQQLQYTAVRAHWHCRSPKPPHPSAQCQGGKAFCHIIVPLTAILQAWNE